MLSINFREAVLFSGINKKKIKCAGYSPVGCSEKKLILNTVDQNNVHGLQPAEKGK